MNPAPTMQDAVDEAGQKARRSSAHDRRRSLYVPPQDVSGMDDLIRRADAAKAGSDKLLAALQRGAGK